MRPITPEQVYVARSLLGWTSYQLAARCEVGQHVIACFEATGRVIRSRARPGESQRDRLAIIRDVLEATGVEFANGDEPGVRLRGTVRRLTRDLERHLSRGAIESAA